MARQGDQIVGQAEGQAGKESEGQDLHKVPEPPALLPVPEEKDPDEQQRHRDAAHPQKQGGQPGAGLEKLVIAQPVLGNVLSVSGDVAGDGGEHGGNRRPRGSKGHRGGVGDQADDAGGHRRKAQRHQQGGRQGGGGSVAGGTLNKGAEQPGNQNRLHPPVGAHPGKAPLDGVHIAAAAEHIQKQNCPEDNKEDLHSLAKAKHAVGCQGLGLHLPDAGSQNHRQQQGKKQRLWGRQPDPPDHHDRQGQQNGRQGQNCVQHRRSSWGYPKNL